MERETVRDQVRRIAEEARAASGALAQTSADERNGALASMAAALRSHAAAIVEANGCDMDAARKAGTKEGLLDRLMLDEDRVEAMAAALEDLVALPDPLGAVQQKRTLESGIELQRVSVPLGVVAVVYEARPNVTADAAGICLKSGNAAVLRGGSMAAASNEVIARVLHEAAVEAGMPRGCIGAVTLADRAAADELMQLHGVVDVLIPRGGAGLIRHCVETSKVPVIETGTGNCHVYVHESADYDKARAIIVNAKCRRLGVCNAAETLLVDEAAAEGFLPAALAELADAGVFCGVLFTPTLPWVTDDDATVRGVVEGAAAAGARFVFHMTGVTMRDRQRDHFLDSIAAVDPELPERYRAAYGERYFCNSPRAAENRALFRALCKRHGLLWRMSDIIKAYKPAQPLGAQGSLF